MEQEARISPTDSTRTSEASLGGLKKSFSWLLIGNLFFAATQYLVLLGLIKKTSPETVGVFSLALAVSAPVTLFLAFGLRAVVLSDAKNAHVFSTYFTLRGLTAALSLFVIVCICLIAQYDFLIFRIVVLVSLIKVIESFQDLGYGYLQKSHHNRQIATSMIMRGTLSCTLSTAALFLTQSLTVAVACLLAASLITAIFYDLPKLKSIASQTKSGFWVLSQPELKSMKLLLLLAAPLGLAALLSSLEVNLPRYFIEHFINLRALGVYSALSYPLMLGNQIIGTLALAPSAHLAELAIQRRFDAFRDLLFRLCLIGIGVGAVSSLICVFFGTDILTVLNNADYAKESKAFGIMAIAAGISYVTVFFGSGLSSVQAFRLKFVLQVLTFLALAGFSLFASEYHSLLTMSFAILASAVFSLVIQAGSFFIVVRRLQRSVQGIVIGTT